MKKLGLWRIGDYVPRFLRQIFSVVPTTAKQKTPRETQERRHPGQALQLCSGQAWGLNIG